ALLLEQRSVVKHDDAFVSQGDAVQRSADRACRIGPGQQFILPAILGRIIIKRFHKAAGDILSIPGWAKRLQDIGRRAAKDSRPQDILHLFLTAYLEPNVWMGRLKWLHQRLLKVVELNLIGCFDPQS